MDELLKHRELHFSPLHPDPEQARSAMLLLSDLAGVESIHQLDAQRLSISYRVNLVTLQMIEEALLEVGFHLDNALMVKLKRALVYYTEDAQRSNLGCDKGNNNCTRKVFIRRYSSQEHGCRDERPSHWRIYR